MARPGEVNVILRGQFLVVLRPQQVEILIPNMGFEHVNRAGSFLGELLLKPRPIFDPYVVTGLKGGQASFGAAANAPVLKGFDYDHRATEAEVYARIVLPRPDLDILSFRRKRGPLKATVDPLGLFHDKTPFAIHVLRYSSSDLTQVKMLGHIVTPAPHTIPGVLNADGSMKEFINLHLVAEPDHEPDGDHVISGFDRTIALLPALRGALKLDPGSVEGLLPEEGDFKVKGFTKHELLTAPEVNSALLRIGQRLREGGALGGQFIGTAPLECDPVLTDMTHS